MASPRSIEVKVGLLMLVALAILAGFILIMGGINFQPTYDVLVGFDDPGGLQQGAPVRIAGQKVGKVADIVFRGKCTAPESTAQPLVCVRANLEKRFQADIHANATFYITTAGLLGEQYLAIEPGSDDAAPLASGAAIRGLDPPRLDRLLAESYDLLTTTVSALREHRKTIREAFLGLTATLKGTGAFMEHNQDRLDRIAANLEDLSIESKGAITDAREKLINNPRIERILERTEALTTQAANLSARDVPALLTDARAALASARRVVDVLGSEEQIALIKKTLTDVSSTVETAKGIAGDAAAITAHIRRGRGTVGALVMDEQLFDDLQEMARDLKHNPWKFFWKE
ncbi:MAG: MCE family protein [Polyangiaceae bacterium]|nr:MCE family protein [Polyangiaceae bacterium]